MSKLNINIFKYILPQSMNSEKETTQGTVFLGNLKTCGKLIPSCKQLLYVHYEQFLFIILQYFIELLVRTSIEELLKIEYEISTDLSFLKVIMKRRNMK